jgi:hypothetical protein
MRHLPCALLALLLCACVTGGVDLDDTGTGDGDTDTDTDADTDTDTDTDLAERWTGVVGMVLQATSAPFCEGEVELTLDQGTALSGDGWCELLGGPGMGEILELGFDGAVSGGTVTGQVALLMQGQPDAPPPVDMTGTVDAQALTLGFTVELRSPENPEDVEIAQGSVQALPAD